MLSQFEHRDVRGRKTMCKSTWGDGHLKPRKDLQQLFPSWLSSCHTLISYFHGAQYCQEISVVQIAQLTVLYFTNSSKINQFPLLLLIYSEHGKGLKINITKIPSFSLFVYNSKNKLILIPPVHMESIKFFSSSFHLRLLPAVPPGVLFATQKECRRTPNCCHPIQKKIPTRASQ